MVKTNKILLSLLILLFAVSCNNEYKKTDSSDNEVDSLIALTDYIVDVDSVVLVETKANLPKKKKHNKKKYSSLRSSKTDAYRLRKYDNVRRFYSRIAKPATQICMENNVPPAAILAIAGLESGWNQGYVGRITGNILSLGAVRNNAELPPLELPTLKKTGDVLFDSLEIIKYDSSELIWKMRPPSLKKDYRPKAIAGTKYQLAYFKYHPDEKAKAQLRNINDFVNSFISRKSRIKVYREARHKMDSLVVLRGKEVLLEESTALLFVYQIGGKPNSFNFRETWPKKLKYIIKNVGLANMTRQLHDNKEFDKVW